MSASFLRRGGRVNLWASRISFASAAPLTEFASRFFRMMLLSRLLSPVEFGTSVALTVVLSIAAMVADIGLDRFVLLNTGSQSRSALAAAHAIQLARGVVIAFILIALAGPVAALFDIPAATASFRWGALVPFIYGFSHLGPKQAQQDYNFRLDAVASIAASIVYLAVTPPAAWLTGNHNAILYSLVAGQTVYVLATHMVADRPYEISLDRKTLREAFGYGLPLMLNGIGLAIMSQADRFLVGATLGVETLGIYSVIVSLAIAGMSPFYAILSGLGVSIIARNRADPARFGSLLHSMAWGFGLFAFAYAAFTGLTLDLLAPKLFGQHAVVDLSVRCLITLIVFIRIIRGPASVLLLVDGETRNLAFANLIAGVGLACAVLFVHLAPMMEAVLLGVLIGDILSLGLFQRFLLRQAPSQFQQIVSVLVFELVAVAGLLTALAFTHGTDAWGRVLIALACCCVGGWMAWRAVGAARGSTSPVGSAASRGAIRPVEAYANSHDA